MAATLTSTGITFGDATTQSTAAPTGVTTLGGIGSTMPVFLFSTSSYTSNSTIAGSSLIYPTGMTYYTPNGSAYYNFSGNTNYTRAAGSVTGGAWAGAAVSYSRQGAGNRGMEVPPGTAQLSGTWRILSSVYAGNYSYDSSYQQYNALWNGTIAVRIS